MKFLTLATALLLTSVSMAAHATVVTFDSAKGKNGNTGYVNGAYSEQGYSVTASQCSSGSCFIARAQNTSNLDNAGAALTNMVEGAAITVAKQDGGAFLLNAITLANISGNNFGFFNYPVTDTVAFTFNFADGTSSTSNYTIANTIGQSVTANVLSFDLAALTSFSFLPTTNTDGFIQFDNLNVSAATAASVPEPASWAMMIGGFGMIGGALRRRARSMIRFA